MRRRIVSFASLFLSAALLISSCCGCAKKKENESDLDEEIVEVIKNYGKAVKKLIKDTSIFGKPAVLKSMQDTADSEEYTPIKEHIEKQLEELQQFRDEMAAPFEANLFADQQCGAAILSVIDSAKKALEKTKVELDEKRSRYQLA